MAKGYKTRGYLRNESDGTYRVIHYDSLTHNIIGGLPKDWEPDPFSQIAFDRAVNKWRVLFCGHDMCGWQLRVNRLAQGYTQQAFSRAVGLVGNASTVHFWEHGGTYGDRSGPVPKRNRDKIHKILGINRRPIDINRESIRAFDRYMRSAIANGYRNPKAPDATGWTHKRFAAWMGIPFETWREYYEGDRNPPIPVRNRWYALWCCVPDLVNNPQWNPKGDKKK